VRVDATGAIISIRILAQALSQAELRALEKQQAQRLEKLRAERLYDSIDRRMTPEECAELPMVGDLSKTLHLPNSAGIGWAYRSAVKRRIPKMDEPDIVTAARVEMARRRAALA
jgi:hypothetical protein